MAYKLYDSQIKNPVLRWIDSRLPMFTLLDKEYGQFPMPKNVNYFWSFGAILSVILVIMILSGIFLATHYIPHPDYAFASIEHIMRDVNWGWLLRYVHMNGASMFFLAVYIHIFRALYYGSYKEPRELLWIIGVLIFILMMATGFMGYVLPWGQMSFWAATVITNVFSAIPIIGDYIVTWILGDYTLSGAALNRFFVFHYLLPFVIFVCVFFHVITLHITGSNNPVGIDPKSKQDFITFHPYITIKDTVAMALFFILYFFFVFFYPEYLGHPDNYIEANPLSTPPHIVPEWYFLPYYAILRAIDFNFFWIIPAKLGGVIALFGSLIVLFFLPWLDLSRVKSCRFRPIFRIFVFLFVLDFILLGAMGSLPAEGIYVTIAQFGTFYYFLHFLVITPLVSLLEKPSPIPNSIATPVLDKQ